MFKVILFLKRKEGLTREQFISYYEERHAKLACEVLPPILDYRRNYPVFDDPLSFSGVTEDPSNYPANGERPSFQNFDVITEVSFADRSGFEDLMAVLRTSPAGQIIAADEAQFMNRDASRVLVVEEYRSPPPT